MLVRIPYDRTAERVASRLTHVQDLPCLLKRSLTWDQGLELAAHAKFSLATDQCPNPRVSLTRPMFSSVGPKESWVPKLCEPLVSEF